MPLRRRLPGEACRQRAADNLKVGEHRPALRRTGCRGVHIALKGTEQGLKLSRPVRYRSSLQVMIFVIKISCLSRGPDDQGLSCGPGESSSSGKGLSGGGLKRLKNREKGRKHSPARAAVADGGVAGRAL